MDPASSPEAAILQIAMGARVAQALRAVADLGVADHFGEGSKTSAELAAACGCDASALRRTLRMLRGAGVFADAAGERGDAWVLTAVGGALQRDAAHSMRDAAVAINDPGHWGPWGRFPDALRTGTGQLSAVTQRRNLWAYLEDHPAEAATFSGYMRAISQMVLPALLSSYDFSRAQVIADVAGAHGLLLAGILRKHRTAAGILFDRPHVVAGAAATLDDVAGRVELVGGDFFSDPIPAADLYILKHIIHDWDDARAVQILAAVRAAMAPAAKLLIIEMLEPEYGAPSPYYAIDPNMMVVLGDGARERTVEEYSTLLEKAGFQLDRTIPTSSPYGIFEASVRAE